MLVFRVRDYANKDDINYYEGQPIANTVKLELDTELRARWFANADKPLADKDITERWIYFYAELDTTGP